MQHLPVRLTRRPSAWASVFSRSFLTVLWAALFVAFLRYVQEPLAVVAFIGMVGTGMLCDAAVQFRRALNHHEPLVEIDKHALTYGGSAQVHVVEPATSLIAEMHVKLVGDCKVTSGTDVSQHREQVLSQERCYEQELLRLTAMPREPVNRMLHIMLPKSPPAEGIAWKIVVASRLKQGGVVEHPYPLPVHSA